MTFCKRHSGRVRMFRTRGRRACTSVTVPSLMVITGSRISRFVMGHTNERTPTRSVDDSCRRPAARRRGLLAFILYLYPLMLYFGCLVAMVKIAGVLLSYCLSLFQLPEPRAMPSLSLRSFDTANRKSKLVRPSYLAAQSTTEGPCRSRGYVSNLSGPLWSFAAACQNLGPLTPGMTWLW